MFRALSLRSLYDGLSLLVGCCLLMFGFIWLRLWIVSQIDFKGATRFFNRLMPDFIQKLLPVPFDVIATIEGRITFGYEELPVGLLIALWTVTRGSECLAGRLGDGTMEMLLAQPVRRLTLLTSHVFITLFGLAMIAFSAWAATTIGIWTVGFEEPTSPKVYMPAMVNLFSVGVFMAGAATFASAIARSRAQAVAIFVAFYVVEITCKIIALMTPEMLWLKKFTFLAAYEPTILTLGIHNEPAQHWPLFWQYNGLLVGLGALAVSFAAVAFCHRDVPAPL